MRVARSLRVITIYNMADDITRQEHLQKILCDRQEIVKIFSDLSFYKAQSQQLTQSCNNCVNPFQGLYPHDLTFFNSQIYHICARVSSSFSSPCPPSHLSSSPSKGSQNNQRLPLLPYKKSPTRRRSYTIITYIHREPRSDPLIVSLVSVRPYETKTKLVDSIVFLFLFF